MGVTRIMDIERKLMVGCEFGWRNLEKLRRECGVEDKVGWWLIEKNT